MEATPRRKPSVAPTNRTLNVCRENGTYGLAGTYTLPSANCGTLNEIHAPATMSSVPMSHHERVALPRGGTLAEANGDEEVAEGQAALERRDARQPGGYHAVMLPAATVENPGWISRCQGAPRASVNAVRSTPIRKRIRTAPRKATTSAPRKPGGRAVDVEQLLREPAADACRRGCRPGCSAGNPRAVRVVEHEAGQRAGQEADHDPADRRPCSGIVLLPYPSATVVFERKLQQPRVALDDLELELVLAPAQPVSRDVEGDRVSLAEADGRVARDGGRGDDLVRAMPPSR